MSSAILTPAPGRGPAPAHGATAATGTRHSHRIGNALRAAKVFVGAAFSVAVLGEYGEETGVRRH